MTLQPCKVKIKTCSAFYFQRGNKPERVLSLAEKNLKMFRVFLFLICLTPALAQLPPNFVQRQVAQNLNPTTLAVAPDGRLFVVEKDGEILEIVNESLASTPFLTIPNVDSYNERGLEGFCFHPDFPKIPYCYVYYTVKGTDQNRLSRFRVTGATADPASETVLFDFDKLASTIHNGGMLHFGRDKKLYVSLGDGTNPATAQSMSSFLGKILRLNDDGSIPADNPFVGKAAGLYQAIYALGFRNPFSMDIDPVSGRILVGDVGNVSFEEVNDVLPGRNYGWPLIEGKRTTQDAPANYTDPLYTYGHTPTLCAITGLTLYRPTTMRFPADYRDRAFFSDYCSGTIQVLDLVTGQVVSTLVTNINRPTGIVVAPNGDLYYIARGGLANGANGSQQDNTSTSLGAVYKVSYATSQVPYITQQSTGTVVAAGEAVTFDVEAAGQNPLTYRWYRNGKLIAGASQNQYKINSAVLADNESTFQCVVSNTLGADTTKSMLLRVVTGPRPVAYIRQPLENATYRAGQFISYAGEARNAGQQPLSNETLTWWIDFHHDTHTHPALDPVTGLTSGTYKVPLVGETSTNVWYRFHLRVTDASGLSSETYRDVKPQLGVVTLGSKQAGAHLIVDGLPQTLPFTFSAVAGTFHTFEAKPYLSTPDGFSKFTGWNATQTLTLVNYETPVGSAVINANYTPLPPAGGNGLLAEYYSDRSEFTDAPTLVRIDPTVDFSWANTPPDSRVSPNTFLVRWTGQLRAPFSDTYTIYPEVDGGLRLWIDNKLVIDKWASQLPSQWSATVGLAAGQLYPIRLEYRNTGANALAHLRWSGIQFDKAVISKSQLFGNLVVTANELETNASLTVFPQPAHGQVMVRYAAVKPGSVQVDITDLLGRRVYQQTVHCTAGPNDYPISIADWSAGLYQISVQAADQSAVFRRLLIH